MRSCALLDDPLKTLAGLTNSTTPITTNTKTIHENLFYRPYGFSKSPQEPSYIRPSSPFRWNIYLVLRAQLCLRGTLRQATQCHIWTCRKRLPGKPGQIVEDWENRLQYFVLPSCEEMINLLDVLPVPLHILLSSRSRNESLRKLQQ